MGKKINWFFVGLLIILGMAFGVVTIDLILGDMRKYNIELGEAKYSARAGNVDFMEVHLTLAEWAAEKERVDISEKTKAIRLIGWEKAARENLEDALRYAAKGDIVQMESYLEHYRSFCSKAGIKVDEAKIKKIRKLAEENSKKPCLSKVFFICYLLIDANLDSLNKRSPVMRVSLIFKVD